MASVSADGNVGEIERAPADIPLVIAASSLGTVFEWYDFFIYGTLAASGIIGATFFPSGNETLQTLLAWAGFAVGFGFRPLGAILFGYLGDKLGRKYTFLITITIMGLATAGVGLIPSAASIGLAAPILIILLRIAQGLALGGEYGGAAIYVAEHAPPRRRGFFTSFIQASVAGGFILSLAVVLLTKGAMSANTFAEWGWRVPFLLSLVLLAVSLWMRLKLSESPVFKAMKAAGETAGNPFVESFTWPGNLKRLLVALFGVAAGLTVIWYTAMFSTLSFLTGPMRVNATAAQLIVGAGALFGLVFFIAFGRLSDRVGRRPPILWGYAITLVVLFPLFWAMGAVANPALAEAARSSPVVIGSAPCPYNAFAARQDDLCAQTLAELGRLGVPYSFDGARATTSKGLSVAIGPRVVPVLDATQLQPALEAQGYDFAPVVPDAGRIAVIVLCVVAMSALAGATYGPVAAVLTEMFPPRIRYSSMSIPYHIGTGYFGGFLPFIAALIAARTGDAYAGLWYCWGVVLMALAVAWWGLEETLERGGVRAAVDATSAAA